MSDDDKRKIRFAEADTTRKRDSLKRQEKALDKCKKEGGSCAAIEDGVKKTKKTLSKLTKEEKKLKYDIADKDVQRLARKKKKAIKNVKHYQGYRKRGSINKQNCLRKGGACNLEKKALQEVERKLEQKKKIEREIKKQYSESIRNRNKHKLKLKL
jgi:hypothetical protein